VCGVYDIVHSVYIINPSTQKINLTTLTTLCHQPPQPHHIIYTHIQFPQEKNLTGASITVRYLLVVLTSDVDYVVCINDIVCIKYKLLTMLQCRLQMVEYVQICICVYIDIICTVWNIVNKRVIKGYIGISREKGVDYGVVSGL